ncbi:RING/FYVE/PHD zinc finger superfamily protein [Hibiscus syriacus]|uniref:RING/FYVE/PHD zinc finger superfamily protein n=1 Tax=Hibiscus syriacus TaxID=106335 RepID=A0A6A2ZVV9_HIBSY|nr:RING/FYVE/PHD zinc finger superfamily protein [Hibiscus syriacus]
MADIAMLVAEEYERRLRNRVGPAKQAESGSCVAMLGLKLKGKIGDLRIEVPRLGFEPKSEVGVVAFHGAFSA